MKFDSKLRRSCSIIVVAMLLGVAHPGPGHATGDLPSGARAGEEATPGAPEARSASEMEQLAGFTLQQLLLATVTVASKTEESVSDAPSSVSIFTRKQLVDMGIENVYDVLNYVPGFQTTREVIDGDNTVILARGVSRANNSNHVLFLLNGHRLNQGHTGGVTVFMRSIPVRLVKQIEIVRGPGSALYGSNAFLGIVNIITDSETNEVYVAAGSHRDTQAALNVEREAGPFHVALFANFHSSAGERYSLPTGEHTKDPERGHNIYTQVKFKDLTVNGLYYFNRQEDFFQFSSLGNNQNWDETWKWAFDANYKWIESDSLEIESTISYAQHRWEALARLGGAGDDLGAGALPADWLAGPIYDNREVEVSTDAKYRFNTSHVLLVGATYRFLENHRSRTLTNFADLTATPPTFGPVPGDYLGEVARLNLGISDAVERSRDIFGLYFQHKATLTEWATLFAGVRYDYYSDFGSSVNPRVGLVLKTPFQSKAKLLYGRAFRAPSLTELYQESPIEQPNKDLDPEKVQTLEFVYSQEFGKNLQATLTYFYSDIDDVIQGVLQVGTGRILRVNQGSVNTHGLEFEFTAKLNSDMSVVGNYTHIYSGLSGDAFRDFGSLAVNYQLKRWNFNLNMIARSKMKRELPGQGSYALFNSKVQFQVAKNLSIDLTAKNILDKDYQTNGAQLDPALYRNEVPNRGRELFGGVSLRF